VIPAAFDYYRASSVDEAARLLGQHGESAKILAGGHSLIPLMRLRLAQPGVLVDINPLEKDLGYIRRDNGTIRIGALTRHHLLEESAEIRKGLPLLAEIAHEVGDTQIRTMGTVGGVLAHGDAAGDYCTLAVMLDAQITTNKRTIPASGFFQGVLTTSLEPDEVLIEVAFPVAAGRHKYIKFRRRLYDWAVVGVGAQQLDGGEWRVGVTNAGPTVVRASAVEQALAQGASPAEASRQVVQAIDPPSDLRGSAEFKRHLATVLTQRAVEGASTS